MGQLYDMCQKINAEIERTGLDVFKTRGAIAMEVGFLITLVGQDDADDPVKMTALRGAASKILNMTV